MRGLPMMMLVGSIAALATPVFAEDADQARIRSAVERALTPVQKGLKTFEARKTLTPVEAFPTLPTAYRKAGCISCHHEGLGLTALSSLREKGFAIDEDIVGRLTETLRHGYGEFAPLYRQALTDDHAVKEADFFEDIAVQMGYMLGGLLDAGHKPDETTDAAARLLLKVQLEDGSWSYTYDRLPMQSSDFTTTAMAARVLRAYAPKDRAEQANEAVALARTWLLENSPDTTDDLAFRLLGLKWTEASSDEVQRAVKPLREAQRSDGGWSQVSPSGESDAYATGLALVALHQVGVSTDDPAYRRGVKYLLETQKPDGTWFVRKRANGLNRYFDAGFPYGKSQFISLGATYYAAMALASAVETPKPAE